MASKFTLKEMERMSQGLPPWESISFACGGWLQFYMFGVGKALQTAGLDKGVMYCGCSAGALTAAGLAVNGDFDDAIVYCKEDAVPTAYKSLYNLFQLQNYVGGSVDRCLAPHFDQEKLKNLQVSATRLSFTNMAERIKTFKSIPDFKSALLASCAAYPVATMEYRDNAYYVDGGLTDFQPIIDADTITVSPFYFSDCDIKPSRYVPLWWAFLPPNSNDTIDWLYSLGYEDGLRYIEKRDILSHIVRIPNLMSTSSESVTSTSTKSTATTITNSSENESGRTTDTMTTTESSVTTPQYLQSHATQRTVVKTTKKHKKSALNQVKTLFHDLASLFRSRMIAQPHPYDVPRTVSMHRFLGYDLAKMTNNKIAFLLDLYLLALLLFVWKPFALALIYFELLWRIVYLTTLCILNLIGVDGYVLYKLNILKPSLYSSKQSVYMKLYDCLLCVLSLSLLLRFISGGPSAVEDRRHDRLAKNSLLYRVFRHII